MSTFFSLSDMHRRKIPLTGFGNVFFYLHVSVFIELIFYHWASTK